jgi:hypothetical protein
MDIQAGYVHPETKRIAVTAKQFVSNDINGSECAFQYSQEAEDMGMECWRMIEGIDAHTKGGKYDLWFVNGSIPRVIDSDYLIFVQKNHYDKYFSPVESVKFHPGNAVRIVLKYKTFPTESYISMDDMYVAIDDQSGGYPYRKTALRAHDFQTREEAKRYNEMFKNKFDIVELTATFSEKNLNNS